MMPSELRIDLEVDVEVDEDELEIEVGDSDTASAELHRDGLDIEITADIDRGAPPTAEYEEPEFDDAATDETIESMDTSVETIGDEEDD